MREILFRGERRDNGEMVYGDLVRNYFSAGDTCIGGMFENLYICFPVVPDTVGEYTGLEDKNGKRIFDGDIIRFGGHILYVYWNDEVYGWQAKRNVEYPYRRFPNKKWDYVDLGWIAAEIPCTGQISVEVIGNIHDNPELLKGGEG